MFVARVAATAAARCIRRRMRASLVVFRRRLSPGDRVRYCGTVSAARCVGVGRRPPPCALSGVCGSDRASASGAAWGCEPYGGFGGVPSPWSEPSDATPLAALVAGDICGQRILAGTPGTLPAGCRGVGAPARPAGGVPQRRVAGSSGSGAVVPSGWLHVRGFRGQRFGGPGPAEDVSLMINGGGRQVPARKSAKRQSAS